MIAELLRIGLTNALVAGVLTLIVIALGGVLKKRAALTHAFCVLILVKLVAPPLVSVPVDVPWPATLTSTLKAAETPESSVATGADVHADLAVPSRSESTAQRPIADGRWGALIVRLAAFPWSLALAMVWGLGTIGYLVVTLTRFVRFRRLLRHARPLGGDLARDATSLARDIGLRVSPRFVTVPGRVSPLVWALSRRPRVVLPAGLLQDLDHDAALALIAHELAHLRRGDHWVRLLEVAVTALYWWNPMVRIVRARLHQAEEECCDAWVVWALPAATERYAASLVTTMRFLSDTRLALPPATSGARHFRSLQRRLTMIMTDTHARRLSWTGRLAMALAAVSLLPFLPMAAEAEDRGFDKGGMIVTVSGPGGSGERSIVIRASDQRVGPADDSPATVRRWVETELGQAIEQLVRDYERELRASRDALRQAVRSEGVEVQAVLLDLDLGAIVDDLLHDAPESLRLFAEEVDVPEVVREALHRVDASRVRVSAGEARDIERRVELELRSGLVRRERGIAAEVEDWRRAIRASVRGISAEARRTVASLDFDRLVRDLTFDAPDPVRQLIDEIDVPTHVDRALRSTY